MKKFKNYLMLTWISVIMIGLSSCTFYVKSECAWVKSAPKLESPVREYKEFFVYHNESMKKYCR